MQSVTVEVFKAAELTGAALERARDWYRQGIEFGAFGEIYEPAETAAKLLGVTFGSVPVKLMGGGTRYDPDIRWSGFSSQGDGASFVGEYAYRKGSAKAVRAEFGEDTELWRIADALAALQKRHGYRIRAAVNQSGNYSHEMTMQAEAYIEGRRFRDEESADESDAAVSDAVLELMREFARWIYRGLEAEYEHQNSDEQVDDSLAANEYDFTADGRRFVV